MLTEQMIAAKIEELSHLPIEEIKELRKYHHRLSGLAQVCFEERDKSNLIATACSSIIEAWKREQILVIKGERHREIKRMMDESMAERMKDTPDWTKISMLQVGIEPMLAELMESYYEFCTEMYEHLIDKRHRYPKKFWSHEKEFAEACEALERERDEAQQHEVA